MEKCNKRCDVCLQKDAKYVILKLLETYYCGKECHENGPGIGGGEEENLVFNLTDLASKNELYRRYLWQTKHQQALVMHVKEEIAWEKHPGITQFISIKEGEARVIIEDTYYILKAGDSIVIPEGKYHYVRNTKYPQEADVLKLFVIYSPPLHVNINNEM